MFITGIIVGVLGTLLLGGLIIWRLNSISKYSSEEESEWI